MASATDAQNILTLPVFYVNLDPAGIPDEDHFDTEHPPADAESCIGRALQSIEALNGIQIPTGIGPDIWPRVWPWVQFIYMYRDHLPNISRQSERAFCLEFLMFTGAFADHAETISLILSTPGVRFMVAKAWPYVPEIVDPKERQLGFNDLRSFMVDEAFTDTNNLAEMIDGAGGTLGHLARLIVLYIRGMVPEPGTAMRDGYAHFTCAILNLITRLEPQLHDPESSGDPLGPLGTALASHHIIRALIDVVCALGEVASPQATFALRKCFIILEIMLLAPTHGIQSLTKGLKHNLLRALITCARGPNAGTSTIHSHMETFFVGIIPPLLVYPGVLNALDRALTDVGAGSDAFKNSEVYAKWETFFTLAEERIGVLRSYTSGETPSMRACDNIKCSEIRIKSGFRRCSGCRCLYYCCQACQTFDWLEGGHRSACKSYGTLSLRDENDIELTARHRSFLRALIHHDYQKSKALIFPQKLLAIKVGLDFLTLYDYTEGPAKINVQALSSERTRELLGGPEWTNLVSRAERSEGRLSLDVVVLMGPDKPQYWTIPLRTNTSTVDHGLREIAEQLPSDRAAWDTDSINAQLEPLVLHGEEPEVLEVH
ncbi:hypothetical protein DFH07DRAFT_962189 [Mycena maculata]|uniref:phytol kinase n=1 Tax=Mycena maculata TaxID=230809 RepID=A0AAD7IQB4_9AGAR|nr:hypothetical protein DFH07DRAFT_962189 [Mycena maculata]